MIEGDWSFCGTNTFGMPLEDGKSFLHNAPFLDYQFAGIVVDRILMPWRNQTLQCLSELSYANKKANWFGLLLANYVLQHTYGLLMRQQRALAIEFRKPVGDGSTQFPLYRFFGKTNSHSRYAILPWPLSIASTWAPEPYLVISTISSRVQSRLITTGPPNK